MENKILSTYNLHGLERPTWFYCLGILSVFGIIACCSVCLNSTTTHPNEFNSPIGPEASQNQVLNLLVRDQRLEAKVGTARESTSLCKYLVCSTMSP